MSSIRPAWILVIAILSATSLACPTRPIQTNDGGRGGTSVGLLDGGAGSGGIGGVAGIPTGVGGGGLGGGAAGQGVAGGVGGMASGGAGEQVGAAGNGLAGAGGGAGMTPGGTNGQAGAAGNALGAAGDVGGSAGGGGTLKTLGETCGRDQDCSGGHCVGSVCCDQACNGLCEQCSTSGRCQMPVDDPGCGTIACPNDTICRDYATNISAGRCKSLGSCKTAADCGYVDAPTTKYCASQEPPSSAQSSCDGAGNCASPTVSCGGDGECSVDGMVCCSDGSGFTCLPVAAFNTSFASYQCDSTSDCQVGDICCLAHTPGGTASFCTTQCGGPGAMGTYVQVCDSTASVSECLTGSCKPARPEDPSAPPGFYTCQ